MPSILLPLSKTFRTGFPRLVGFSRIAIVCVVSLLGLGLASPLAEAHGRHRHHHHRRHHRHHHRQHQARARSAAIDSGPWSATAPCANADTTYSSATVAEMTQAVDCLINQERLKFGLPPLNVSAKLDNSAQGWSNYEAANGIYEHGNVMSRVSAAGYNWGDLGENIMMGSLTPRDVVAVWMGSTEHCQNILDPNFADMGAGETPSGPIPPMWTVDFGLLMRTNSPSSNYGPLNGCPYNIPYSPAVPPAPSGSGSGSSSSGSGSSSSGSGSGSSSSGTGSGPQWPTSPSDTPTG